MNINNLLKSLSCDKEFIFIKNRSEKYCSNKCQQDYLFEENTMPKYSLGEINNPKTLRRILFKTVKDTIRSY